MKYINKDFSDKQRIFYDFYKALKEKSTTLLDKDITNNSIMNLVSNLYFPNEFGKISIAPEKILQSFLIQVFMYNYYKNSLSMDYKAEKLDNSIISLKDINFEGRFSYIAIAPIKIEPRISEVELPHNNIRECGLYELGKVLLFNKSIKNINANTSFLRNNYLDYLNNALGIYDNYSVKELHLSFNNLKDISEEFLAKFKELKTLNLKMNELKGGISIFLMVLKKLYRKGETKLENLCLDKCLLDDSSFYELGELLKCKYCKLKKLYLNKNILPKNINFLKN